MKFILYKNRKGEWCWSLKAPNHKIIADSGESYKDKRDAVTMIHRIRNERPWPIVEAA